MIRGEAGWGGEGLQAYWDGAGHGGGAGWQEGPQKVGQLTPPPAQAGLLAAMGVIATSRSGGYGLLVAGFLYT